MATTLRDLDLRVLDSQDDVFPALARLLHDAYPILRLENDEATARFTERLREIARGPESRIVVAFHDGFPAGMMALYDFTMRVRGRDVAAVGIGSLAVGLAHKRRGIARTLVRRSLEDARADGAAFALLHPFRLDFYRALGFGYGTPQQRYRFAPAALRVEGARGTVRLLGEDDLDALLACSERLRAATNGLLARHRDATARLLADRQLRYVGVEEDGVLRGFMQTTVVLGPDGTFNRNELLVRDLLAESPAHLAALLGYLRAQRDQFARVVVETQDENFALVADDPRDGSDLRVAPPGTHRVAETGLGIMYRILDPDRAFALLPPVETPFTLRVELDDPFFAATSGAWTFRFGPHGAPHRDEDALPDATLVLGVHDCSSLIAGSLDLHALVRHRLAALEPAGAFERVARAFAVDQRPLCMTRF
jgi:predicted N-acetyltransferase YhbS